MYGLETIKAINEEYGRKRLAVYRGSINPRDFKIEHIHPAWKGHFQGKKWKKVDEMFVSKLPFPDGGPALSQQTFLQRVQEEYPEGVGYAITEEGQFQLYVGVYVHKRLLDWMEKWGTPEQKRLLQQWKKAFDEIA